MSNNNEIGQSYDVVVVGGGAAGLSGAAALSRSNRSVLVVDAGEPRNTPAARMHNFLPRDGMTRSRFSRSVERRSAATVAMSSAAAFAPPHRTRTDSV
jgi:thioredoxin reductase